jgi:hypothetical protein
LRIIKHNPDEDEMGGGDVEGGRGSTINMKFRRDGCAF